MIEGKKMVSIFWHDKVMIMFLNGTQNLHI
jgi:hypothetical protein